MPSCTPSETALDRDIGGKRQFREADRWIAELANAQHGVVSRAQLVAAGLGPGLIDHRLDCGRLHVFHRGVYSVGYRLLTKEGRWMAAVLAGGPAATLSHRSAGELWGLIP